MNDNGNPSNPSNPIPSIPSIPPEPVTFIITYDRLSGALNIQGPLHDRVLAYGILESAKEALIHMGLEKGRGSEGGRILVPRR